MPVLPQPFSNQPLSHWIAQFLQAESAEERLRALQAIGLQADSDEVSRLAHQGLADADSTIRAVAAKLLGLHPDGNSGEANSKIAVLLSDDDPDTRFEAARALMRRKSEHRGEAIRALFSFLDEGETQALMVASIINALVEADQLPELDLASFLPQLERRLEDDRAEVREAVAAAFAKWPALCEPVIDKLLPMLDDSEPIVREKIASALGQAGLLSPQILESLQAAAHDEDTEVARIAQEAIQRLTTK